MKDPHNYRKVGYAMIAVSASLAVIALVGLAIGHDVLFGDNIQRAKTAEFQNCKTTNFEGPECEKYFDRINNEISGIYVNKTK